MAIAKHAPADAPRIGDLAIRHRLATPRDVREALSEQRRRGRRTTCPPLLGEILLEKEVLQKAQLHRILSEQDRLRGLVTEIIPAGGGVVLLRLKGAMDRLRGHSVRLCLDRLIDEGQTRFVIDCSGLTYVDSNGVSTFIAYVDECRALGGDIKLVRIPARVAAVFRQLGIGHFIQIFTEARKAVTAFGTTIDHVLERGPVSEYLSGERTRYVHLAYCASARRIPLEEQLSYPARQDAFDAGKTPCPKCCP